MSWFNTKKSDERFKEIVVKALNNNQWLAEINKALFKFVGTNMPVWMSQNVESYIVNGYYANPDLFAVINKISGMAATVPWVVKKKVGDEYETLPDHELNKLWNKPNELQSGVGFRKAAIEYYLVTGNSYINCMSPENGLNKGKIIEMHIMPSQHVEIISNGWREPVKEYIINYDREIKIPKEDVCHVKTTNLNSTNGEQLYGMSPLTAASKAITTSNDGYTTKASMFQNQGIRGFISRDGDEALDFTKEQASYVEGKLAQKYGGAKNAGKLAAIGGRAKWNAVGLSAVDLAVLESIKGDLRTFCNIYGISSILFNDTESSTYNNVSEAKKEAYTNVVMPLLDLFSGEINRSINGRYEEGITIEPDYSSIQELQEDIGQLAETLSKAWWITPNQKNVLMGQPKVDDKSFDVPWIPVGLMPLTDLLIDDENVDEELVKRGINEYR